MPSARALSALFVLVGLTVPAGANAAPPERVFSGLQDEILEPLAADRLWRALPAAQTLSSRPDLSPPQRAWALRESGRLRGLLGDRADAEQLLGRAVDVLPGDSAARLQLAGLLRDERPDDALAFAVAAASVAPTTSERALALRAAGEISLDAGDRAGAVERLVEAVRLGGEDVDALAALARASAPEQAAASGYARRARAAAGRAPLWYRGAALRWCGRMWLDLGEPSAAVESFDAALALDPDDLDALDGLAEVRAQEPSRPLFVSTSAPADVVASSAPLDELERLRAAFVAARDAGRRPEALRLAYRFIDAVPDAPVWRRPEAYAAIAEQLLTLGDPAAGEAADGSARRAFELGLHRVRFALLLMRAHPAADSPQAPGSAQFAGQTYNEAVEARLRLGDGDGARACIERGLRRLPEDPELTLAEARLALAAGDAGHALASARRVAAAAVAAGVKAAAYELQGSAQRALGDASAARDSLERALAVDPFEPRALHLLIDAEASAGRPAEALAYARRLFDASTSPADKAAACRRQARLERQLGDAAGARASLERALSLLPADPEALVQMLDLLADSQPREALAFADRLIAARRDAGPGPRAEAFGRRARVLARLGDDAGAEKSFGEALSLLPADPDLLAAACDFELDHGRARAALAHADRILAAAAGASARAAAYERRAKAQQRLGEPARAAASLREALAAAPSDLSALKQLVALERKAGRGDEARRLSARLREELDAAIARGPSDWAAIRERAAVELADAHPRAAVEALDAHSPAPGASWASAWRLWRGLASAREGDLARGRSDIAAAVESDPSAACLGSDLPPGRDAFDLAYFDACVARLPSSAKLLVDRGVARFGAGRREEALADFRAAVSLDGRSADASISLVSALASLGRAKEALAAADSALAATSKDSPAYAPLSALRAGLARGR